MTEKCHHILHDKFYIHHKGNLPFSCDFLTPLNAEHSINSAMRKSWAAAAFLCWTVCGLSSSHNQTHMARWLCSLCLSVRRRVAVCLPARLWGWGRDGSWVAGLPSGQGPGSAACLLGDRRQRSAPFASFFSLRPGGPPNLLIYHSLSLTHSIRSQFYKLCILSRSIMILFTVKKNIYIYRNCFYIIAPQAPFTGVQTLNGCVTCLTLHRKRA